MSDGPVLVVSDTHLGFQSASAERFRRFVQYLTKWVQDGETTIEKMDKPLIAPQKIILLGDFLDLLISRDPNIVRPHQESFDIVNSLVALGREIVYVVGNHDDAMRSYAGSHTFHNWRVYKDRYPETCVNGKWQGVPIGDKTYLFLHGHQFDIFGYESVIHFSNFIGSATIAAQGFRKFTYLGGVVFALSFFTALLAFFPSALPSASSAMFDLADSLYTQLGAGVVVLGGWLLLVPIVFLGILWLFGVLMTKYYDLFRRPRCMQFLNWTWRLRRSTRGVIRSYSFKRKEPKIDADVLIFGHNHDPDICIREDRRITQLVNAGSWVVQCDGSNDTFVYIDDTGPRLFQWQDSSGKVAEFK
jgi:UDP-2,3-diacylglucosamine pyrophosphatase LpxH